MLFIIYYLCLFFCIAEEWPVLSTAGASMPMRLRKKKARVGELSLVHNISEVQFLKSAVLVTHPLTRVQTSYANIVTAYEKEDLTLHMCNEPGEAYSASYLTTKTHMLEGI